MDERENLINSVIDQCANYKTEKAVIHKYDFSYDEKSFIVEQIYFMYPLALRRIAEDEFTDSDTLEAIYRICDKDPYFPMGSILMHPNCPESLLLNCIVSSIDQIDDERRIRKAHEINHYVVQNPNSTDKVLKKLFSIYFGNKTASQKILFTMVSKQNLSDSMFVLLLTNLQSPAVEEFADPLVASQKVTSYNDNDVFNPATLIYALLETIGTDERSELWWDYSNAETRKFLSWKDLSLLDMKVSPMVWVENMIFYKARSLPWPFQRSLKLNDTDTLRETLKKYATQHTDYNFDNQDLPVDWMIELLIPYAEERMEDFDNE